MPNVISMNPKNMTSKFSRSARGFTLVELLVVITIIVALAGVAYLSMGRMRASAARSQCISQLRGWGGAMGSYAADHDGKVEWRLWAPIGWDKTKTSVYLDYWTAGTVDLAAKDDSGSHGVLQKMRCCPAVKKNPVGNSPVTYSTIRPNAAGVLEPNVSTVTLAKITNPARFMLLVESLPASNLTLTAGDFSTRVKPLTLAGPDLRHDGSVNVLLADYSVQSMTWKQIEKGLAYWTTY